MLSANKTKQRPKISILSRYVYSIIRRNKTILKIPLYFDVRRVSKDKRDVLRNITFIFNFFFKKKGLFLSEHVYFLRTKNFVNLTKTCFLKTRLLTHT